MSAWQQAVLKANAADRWDMDELGSTLDQAVHMASRGLHGVEESHLQSWDLDNALVRGGEYAFVSSATSEHAERATMDLNAVFEQAKIDFAEGKLQEAVAGFEAVVREDSTHSEAWRMLVRIDREGGIGQGALVKRPWSGSVGQTGYLPPAYSAIHCSSIVHCCY